MVTYAAMKACEGFGRRRVPRGMRAYTALNWTNRRGRKLEAGALATGASLGHGHVPSPAQPSLIRIVSRDLTTPRLPASRPVHPQLQPLILPCILIGFCRPNMALSYPQLWRGHGGGRGRCARAQGRAAAAAGRGRDSVAAAV